MASADARPQTIRKLARVLGVEPKELVKREEEQVVGEEEATWERRGHRICPQE